MFCCQLLEWLYLFCPFSSSFSNTIPVTGALISLYIMDRRLRNENETKLNNTMTSLFMKVIFLRMFPADAVFFILFIIGNWQPWGHINAVIEAFLLDRNLYFMME